MTAERTALIVGAGIGGLSAGLALGRAGWRVRVVERSATPRELGFALLLAPNAMAALDELGVAKAVRAAAGTPTSAEIRRPDGRILRRIDVSDSHAAIGGVPVVARRRALHGTLLSAVGPDVLTLDTAATGFEIRDGRPRLRLSNGEVLDGDVLIGADGVGSLVRRILHPDEPPPRSSGLSALRGVVHGTGRYLDGLGGVLYLGRGLESAVVEAGDDVLYFYVSLPTEEVAHLDGAPEVFSHCLGRLDDRFRALVGPTRADDMRVDELSDRDPLPHWGDGSVTLLGDAAHPLLPHTGQGAAQALEDAVALGRVLRQASDVDAALRRYETVRAARTTALLHQGRRFARTMRSTNRVLCWGRDTAVRLVPRWLVVTSFVMGQKVDPYAGLDAAARP